MHCVIDWASRLNQWGNVKGTRPRLYGAPHETTHERNVGACSKEPRLESGEGSRRSEGPTGCVESANPKIWAFQMAQRLWSLWVSPSGSESRWGIRRL